MKPPTHLHPEAGVYDPSHRRADTASYWQWTNSCLGERWDRAAEWVNMGWPAKCELKDRSARWYGIMFTDPGDFWVYRVFSAGKDRFGRDERYFFVLIRLRSPEEVMSPHVAGLFSYFDAERGLPLQTEPLDHGWQDAAPDEILEAISKELVRGERRGHWGMDATGSMTMFSEDVPISKELPKPISKQAPPPKPSAPSRTWRIHKLEYALISAAVLVVALLFLFLNRSHRQIDTPPNFPGGTKPRPNAKQPSDATPAKDADKETGRPKADERMQGEDTESKSEPIPGLKEPPDPYSVPKEADGDPPPPDQTPDHPPQPPTESPAIQTKP